MAMIVKVQVPLATNNPVLEGGSYGLVYDKDRKHMLEQFLPPAAITALGHDVKGFFHAEFNGRFWEIGERTINQPW